MSCEGKFAVDSIHDIQFAPDVLQNLVLTQDEKELILAFLNNESGSLAFDDFIPGKGAVHETYPLLSAIAWRVRADWLG